MKKIYIPLILLSVFFVSHGQNVTVLGNASANTALGCNCYTITPDAGNQHGAFYQTHTINLNNSFDYIFSAYWGCGTNCGGNADGMVFSLTANPGSLGGAGQTLGWGNGYGSQPCSVGVEFDTWVNGGSCSSGGECDPNYNELAIMANGDVCHCDAGNTLFGPVPIQPSGAAVYDCAWHTVEIKWVVNTGTLTVYFDGNQRAQVIDLNMINDWFCGNPTVYWGWSGSTGGGCELQQVCIKSTSSWVAGNNYQSCVPTIQFTDVSTVNASNVASWNWQFGDGATSTQQNPLHTYPGPGTYTAELIITDVDGCADTFSHAVVIAPPITLTNTDVNPLCNGAQTGTITVVAANGFGASAGLGGYKYTWNTGGIDSNQIGLGAGTYVVTCTDGICTTTASYTLTQPTALTATTSSTTTVCNGSTGSVSVVISGGVAPYNIDWVAGNYTTATVTGLPAGTYVANFTDHNGCSAALEYRATVPSLPCGYTLTQTSTSEPCYGESVGTITLTVGGPAFSPPATYTWTPPEANSGSLTGLPAGTYSYSVKDQSANPPLTGSVTISQPAQFLVSLAVLPSSCGSTPSGSAVASVTSGGVAPFTYAWSGGHPPNAAINGLSPGPITVTVTDATNCTATATGTINGPTPLTSPVTSVNDSCFLGQGPMGSATANPTGGTPPYSYLWSDSAVAKTVVNLVAGTYVVTVTDAGGCTAMGTASISSLSTTKVSHTISQQNIACFGASTGSITVTPSGGTTPYSYTWNPNTVTGPNPTGLAVGLYAVTVSDALGCQNTDTALLTQPATALAAITATQNVTCNGGSDGYIAFSISGGTSPYSLSYLGQTLPVPAIDTIKNLPAGTYNATVIDSNLCQFPVSVTITQPGAPSVTFSNVTNETCFGQTIGTATATFVNATGSATYIWSNAQNGATASNLAAGTFTVTGTDANGCTVSGSVNITQPASLTLNVAVTNSTCYGQPGTAVATPTPGTPPYAYAWSAPIASTTATASVPAGNNYTVTATDAATCQETATFSLTQPTRISIGISQVNVLCFGNSTGSITLTDTGGTGNTYTYAWNPVSAGTTANPTGLTAGNYSVTVTDQANCSVDSSTIITQPAQALSVVEDSVNIACFGQSTGSITLLVTGGTPQYAYAWTPNTVAADSDPTGLAQGQYTYTVTDANACTLSNSVNLTQPAAALGVTTSGVNVLCFDSSTGVVIATATGGTTAYSYAWNPNVGTTDTVSNVLAGSYSVTVTDNNGCTASAPLVITQPQIGLSETEVQANEKCFGDAIGSITITASGGTGNLTYTWNPNVSTTNTATGLAAGAYATTVTDANGCTLGDTYTVTQPGRLIVTAIGTNDSCFGQNNGTIVATADSGTSPYTYVATDGGGNLPSTTGQFSALAAGNYTVYATDANQCTDSTTVNITQPPLLTATVDSVGPTCYGYSNGSITVTGVGGTPNYNYTFSNGSTNSTGTIFGLAKGTYTYTVTDADNCPYTNSVTLIQPDSLIIEISPAAGQVNLGDTLQLQTTTNQTGAFNYIWDPSSGLSCYDCPNPVFNGVYSQTYQVTVSNQDSCTAAAQFTVTVVPNYNIYIPNAFSPVGNGANDFWQLFGDLASVKQAYVMVFNRIGEKVFESDDVNFKWDGTYKGQPAPEGVYVYSIKFVWLDNHSDDTRKGSITLLR